MGGAEEGLNTNVVEPEAGEGTVLEDKLPRCIRIAMAQINPKVGDLEGNSHKILHFTQKAVQEGADIVVFPELALTGYPPEDLLLKPRFVEENQRRLQEIAEAAKGIVSVVGFVDRQDDIYNAAAVIEDGVVRGVHHKVHLPNYGVFDEDRYFQKGSEVQVFDLDGVRFGVNICEDIWYQGGPTATQALIGGAELMLVLNASPYYRGKWRERERMLATRAVDNGAIICYVNTVGGQDELVFDGMSMVAGPDSRIRARARAFEEHLLVCDIQADEVPHARARDARRRTEKYELQSAGVEVACVQLSSRLKSYGAPDNELSSAAVLTPPLEDLEEAYTALVTGTRDYVHKNGFERVVMGLSGGIDSALTFAIACDALGPDKVLGVTMPSQFTSDDTRSDAEVLAANFGSMLLTLPIEGIFGSFLDALEEPFQGRPRGLAEENLQARIRGTLLMGISNKLGHLVLTTGNKSEMACGYATLYGDMAGGFAVLKDVPKTLVWELSQYRNRDGEMIPVSTIERPPTAELRENQRDTDSLPPYEILDGILQRYVEEDKSLAEIVSAGYEEDVVRRVIAMVDSSEYKRRQAPPGPKITSKAFGRDRRLPITNGFREH